MDKNKTTRTIGFLLKGIKTEQFAILDSVYKEEKDSHFSYEFAFGGNNTKHIIATLAKFRFEQEKVPFLILEISCYFEIEEESWGIMHNEDNELVVKNNFLQQLAMLTVGTARGMLHAKTEGTVFNQFLIPLLDLTKAITEDVVIS